MAKRGRNRKLISLRDEKLLYRWYYWTEICRRRLDDALQILSQEEFFISEERIIAIIRENSHIFERIQKEHAEKGKKALRKLQIFPEDAL